MSMATDLLEFEKAIFEEIESLPGYRFGYILGSVARNPYAIAYE